MINIGVCYENGYGVEQNMSKAFKCYKKSVEMGSNDALFNLAICYENGIGVARNLLKAIEYYEKSAKLGNEKSKNRLKELKESQ